MPGRIVSYLTKFKNLISTDPVLFSDQNTEVNQIYQDLNDLDAGVAKIAGESTQDFAAKILTAYDKANFDTGGQINIPGLISGNLVFNTTALPPKVSSGSREVKGKNIQETADVALALTDSFGVCSQAFTDFSYSWMKILVNNLGEYKFIPSFDQNTVGSLTDIAVSGISVTGGNATVSTANTTGLAAGHMVVIKGSDIGALIGKVVSVSAGVNFVVKTSASNGSYSAGTYSAYYRVATTNTDADVILYQPATIFNPVLQGYYRGTDGDIDITSSGIWRDLGAFYLEASGNASASYVLSYTNRSDEAGKILGITFKTITRHSDGGGYTIFGRDDTVPEITEGSEFADMDVIARSNSSKLLLVANFYMVEGDPSYDDSVSAAMFKSGVSSALVAFGGGQDNGGGGGALCSANIVLTAIVDSHGAGVSLNYSLRGSVGPSSPGNPFSINRVSLGGGNPLDTYGALGFTSQFLCIEFAT